MNLNLRTFTLRMAASVLALSVGALGQGVTDGSLTAVTKQHGPLVARTSEGHAAHIMPTVQYSRQLGVYRGPGAAPALDWGPLLYNSGNAQPYVMPNLQVYMIFWIPTGTGLTPLSSGYQSVVKTLALRWGGHSFSSLITQYYQTISGVTTYPSPAGTLVAYAVDTAAYPSSCNNGVTGSRCFTDGDLRSKIQSVMSAKGWTPGNNKLYMVFTDQGEGSCMDNTNASCAYDNPAHQGGYCGYHSAFGTIASPIIYTNQPYADPNYCWDNTLPLLHSEVAADAASSVASHEMSEAATDPYLQAWYTAQGNEIGDLCAYYYGQLGWYGGRANENWSGTYLTLQQEWNNHSYGCAQVGP